MLKQFVITHPELFPNNLLGFVDPDDYYQYNGINLPGKPFRHYKNLEELLEHIKKRRHAHSHPEIPSLSLVVQQYLYELGEAPKSYFTQIRPSRTGIKDLRTAVSLAVSLSKAALTGAPTSGSYGWVTKSKANERAKICSKCPKNNIPTNHSKLTAFNDRIANLFTTHRSTDHDALLYNCDVCGCPLTSKVHYADNIISEVTQDLSYQDFPEAFIDEDTKRVYACWMRPILKPTQGDK